MKRIWTVDIYFLDEDEEKIEHNFFHEKINDTYFDIVDLWTVNELNSSVFFWTEWIITWISIWFCWICYIMMLHCDFIYAKFNIHFLGYEMNAFKYINWLSRN